MRDRDLIRVLAVLAAGFAGWLLGRACDVARPIASTPVRFAPGRYLFEEPGTPWVWAVEFENAWYVRQLLPPPPVEDPERE